MGGAGSRSIIGHGTGIVCLTYEEDTAIFRYARDDSAIFNNVIHHDCVDAAGTPVYICISLAFVL
jgi:hypothetical protein